MRLADRDVQELLGSIGYSIQRAEEDWAEGSRAGDPAEYDYERLNGAFINLEDVLSEAQDALGLVGLAMDAWECDHAVDECNERYCDRNHEEESREADDMQVWDMARETAHLWG